MAEMVFTPVSGLYDGQVYRTNSGVYPPNTATQTDSSSTVFGTRRGQLSGGTYEIRIGMITFSTSGLPDGAIITGAKLRMFVSSCASADSAQLQVEWYDKPFPNTTDYSATPYNTAVSGVDLSSLTVGVVNDIPLTDLSGISKTGDTGFRLHISDMTPTGNNYVFFASTDGTPDPQLVVTYLEGLIQEAIPATFTISGSASQTSIPVDVPMLAGSLTLAASVPFVDISVFAQMLAATVVIGAGVTNVAYGRTVTGLPAWTILGLSGAESASRQDALPALFWLAAPPFDVNAYAEFLLTLSKSAADVNVRSSAYPARMSSTAISVEVRR